MIKMATSTATINSTTSRSSNGGTQRRSKNVLSLLCLLQLYVVLFNVCSSEVVFAASNDDGKPAPAPTCESKKELGLPAHMSLDLIKLQPDELHDELYLKKTVRGIIDNIPESKLGAIVHMHSYKVSSSPPKKKIQAKEQKEEEGITLVAILSSGTQLSIQTWPEHGKVLIDIIGRNVRSNLQDVVLPIIIEKFKSNFYDATYSIIPRAGLDISGVVDNEDNDNVACNQDDEEDDDEDDDEDDEDENEKIKERKLHHMFVPIELMSQHKYKFKVHEKQSPYQHIAIWDHHDTTSDDYKNETTRSLFLDGVIQSNIDDETKYHEALVHPAFVASNSEPKRVLIVGGGEGGTLATVLEWKSIEHVTMVDLDAEVIATSRSHLPAYSNCTALDGKSHHSCFEDPRLDLYTEDFIAWFDKKIGNDICDKTYEERKDIGLYDVVILDLLDTEELPVGEEWAEHLYSDLFFQRIACATTTKGVVVSNFGEGPAYEDGDYTGIYVGNNTITAAEQAAQDLVIKKMKQVHAMSNHFAHTRLYDTYIASFRGQWSFVMGIAPNVSGSRNDDDSILKNFEASPSEVNEKLRNGLIQSLYPLSSYSGIVHRGFQYPRVDWAGVLCDDKDMRKLCDLYPETLRNHDEITTVSKKRGFDICVMFDTFMTKILMRNPDKKICEFELDGNDSISLEEFAKLYEKSSSTISSSSATSME